MADIGTIADYLDPDDWTEVTPPNVLVLPQAEPPSAPIVAIGPQDTAWLYSDTACGGGTCDILFHDANSGWWFLQAGVDCDGIIDAEGNELDVETFAAGLADGIDLQTGEPFTPNCSLPQWAINALVQTNPAYVQGECDFDYYTIACDDTLTVVSVEIETTIPVQPVQPTPEPCCIGSAQCCIYSGQ
jgi:hypothetical protein